MRSRRLEDRIRELCARAVTTPEPELGEILAQLTLALQEHAKRMKQNAGEQLFNTKRFQERRLTSHPSWTLG